MFLRKWRYFVNDMIFGPILLPCNAFRGDKTRLGGKASQLGSSMMWGNMGRRSGDSSPCQFTTVKYEESTSSPSQILQTDTNAIILRNEFSLAILPLLYQIFGRYFHSFGATLCRGISTSWYATFAGLFFVLLLTYCPTASGFWGSFVSQVVSHSKYGPIWSLLALDLREQENNSRTQEQIKEFFIGERGSQTTPSPYTYSYTRKSDSWILMNIKVFIWAQVAHGASA